jgi:hypothetical protein
VRDTLFVQVDECAKQLFHYRCRLALVQVFFLEDVVKQFAPCAVFKHEKTDSLPFPHFVEFDDVWMVLITKM